jgi:polyhydroxyalkanoate synthesis regulator phasin
MTDAESIEAMVDEIIADGKLTGEEKKRLDELLLADGQLSLDERRAIDRLLVLIGRGELQVEE